MKKNAKKCINKVYITVSVFVILIVILKTVNNPYNNQKNYEESLLTNEQEIVLRERMNEAVFEELNTIEQHNSWLLFESINTEAFRESGYPNFTMSGQSAWLLGLLNIGEIVKLDNVRIDYSSIGNDAFDELIIRSLNYDGVIHYFRFQRMRGIVMVSLGSEDGEILYSTGTHVIINGLILKSN